MDRIRESIMPVHEENGCNAFLSWDAFRKQLGVRSMVYLILYLGDMRNLGAEEFPSGVFNTSCQSAEVASLPASRGEV